ncbi:VanZ family protein [Halomicrobium katesii]|uniref:VanZ family protein n=1 Tax=Halomicrobium katesii TaxID=437163 RepID=UPI0003804A2A|nr:VanZ family protein [Halomicrobium katesii]
MNDLRVPLLPSWLRWLAVAVVGGVIFTLSVVVAPPGEPIVAGPPDLLPLDKWRHFLAYAAFGGTLAYATSTWRWSTGRLAVFVLGITVAYGVGIEIWQSFLPNRYFGLGDAYANALGAVLASPWFLLRDRLSFVSLSEWASAIVD